MSPLHYCVIGIEMGMTSASSISILGTFSTVEAAKKYISEQGRGSKYSMVDILETFIDMPNNNNNIMDLQNSIDLN